MKTKLKKLATFHVDFPSNFIGDKCKIKILPWKISGGATVLRSGVSSGFLESNMKVRF